LENSHPQEARIRGAGCAGWHAHLSCLEWQDSPFFRRLLRHTFGPVSDTAGSLPYVTSSASETPSSGGLSEKDPSSHPRPRGDSDASQCISVAAFREAQARRSTTNSPVPSLPGDRETFPSRQVGNHRHSAFATPPSVLKAGSQAHSRPPSRPPTRRSPARSSTAPLSFASHSKAHYHLAHADVPPIGWAPPRTSSPMFIHDHHVEYAPLHYVLLFPYGTDGWTYGIPIHVNTDNTTNNDASSNNASPWCSLTSLTSWLSRPRGSLSGALGCDGCLVLSTVLGSALSGCLAAPGCLRLPAVRLYAVSGSGLSPAPGSRALHSLATPGCLTLRPLRLSAVSHWLG
jgi:hypothetical protein